MADIFVCYARDDKDKVDPIVKALQEYKFSFYYDEDDKLGNNRWRKKIYQELVNAHCLLIFLSNAIKKSHWMNEERQMFIEHKKNSEKYICCVYIENNLNIGFFPHIDHHSNLTNWKGDLNSQEWQKFISSISQCLSI